MKKSKPLQKIRKQPAPLPEALTAIIQEPTNSYGKNDGCADEKDKTPNIELQSTIQVSEMAGFECHHSSASNVNLGQKKVSSNNTLVKDGSLTCQRNARKEKSSKCKTNRRSASRGQKNSRNASVDSFQSPKEERESENKASNWATQDTQGNSKRKQEKEKCLSKNTAKKKGWSYGLSELTSYVANTLASSFTWNKETKKENSQTQMESVENLPQSNLSKMNEQSRSRSTSTKRSSDSVTRRNEIGSYKRNEYGEEINNETTIKNNATSSGSLRKSRKSKNLDRALDLTTNEVILEYEKEGDTNVEIREKNEEGVSCKITLETNDMGRRSRNSNTSEDFEEKNSDVIMRKRRRSRNKEQVSEPAQLEEKDFSNMKMTRRNRRSRNLEKEISLVNEESELNNDDTSRRRRRRNTDIEKEVVNNSDEIFETIDVSSTVRRRRRRNTEESSSSNSQRNELEISSNALLNTSETVKRRTRNNRETISKACFADIQATPDNSDVRRSRARNHKDIDSMMNNNRGETDALSTISDSTLIRRRPNNTEDKSESSVELSTTFRRRSRNLEENASSSCPAVYHDSKSDDFIYVSDTVRRRRLKHLERNQISHFINEAKNSETIEDIRTEENKTQDEQNINYFELIDNANLNKSLLKSETNFLSNSSQEISKDESDDIKYVNVISCEEQMQIEEKESYTNESNSKTNSKEEIKVSTEKMTTRSELIYDEKNLVLRKAEDKHKIKNEDKNIVNQTVTVNLETFSIAKNIGERDTEMNKEDDEPRGDKEHTNLKENYDEHKATEIQLNENQVNILLTNEIEINSKRINKSETNFLEDTIKPDDKNLDTSKIEKTDFVFVKNEELPEKTLTCNNDNFHQKMTRQKQDNNTQEANNFVESSFSEENFEIKSPEMTLNQMVHSSRNDENKILDKNVFNDLNPLQNNTFALSCHISSDNKEILNTGDELSQKEATVTTSLEENNGCKESHFDEEINVNNKIMQENPVDTHVDLEHITAVIDHQANNVEEIVQNIKIDLVVDNSLNIISSSNESKTEENGSNNIDEESITTLKADDIDFDISEKSLMTSDAIFQENFAMIGKEKSKCFNEDNKKIEILVDELRLSINNESSQDKSVDEETLADKPMEELDIIKLHIKDTTNGDSNIGSNNDVLLAEEKEHIKNDFKKDKNLTKEDSVGEETINPKEPLANKERIKVESLSSQELLTIDGMKNHKNDKDALEINNFSDGEESELVKINFTEDSDDSIPNVLLGDETSIDNFAKFEDAEAIINTNEDELILDERGDNQDSTMSVTYDGEDVYQNYLDNFDVIDQNMCGEEASKNSQEKEGYYEATHRKRLLKRKRRRRTKSWNVGDDYYVNRNGSLSPLEISAKHCVPRRKRKVMHFERGNYERCKDGNGEEIMEGNFLGAINNEKVSEGVQQIFILRKVAIYKKKILVCIINYYDLFLTEVISKLC